jgi:hypothetical protein
LRRIFLAIFATQQRRANHGRAHRMARLSAKPLRKARKNRREAADILEDLLSDAAQLPQSGPHQRDFSALPHGSTFWIEPVVIWSSSTERVSV